MQHQVWSGIIVSYIFPDIDLVSEEMKTNDMVRLIKERLEQFRAEKEYPISSTAVTSGTHVLFVLNIYTFSCWNSVRSQIGVSSR